MNLKRISSWFLLAASLYVHSPELVCIENGQLIRGWDALHDQQLRWWKNGESDAVAA